MTTPTPTEQRMPLPPRALALVLKSSLTLAGVLAAALLAWCPLVASAAVPAKPGVQVAANADALSAWAPLGPWAPPTLRSGHGWFIAQRLPTGEAPLVHIPPRGQGPGSPVAARLAAVLLERPAAIAAAGNSVFVVFRPEQVTVAESDSRSAVGGEAGAQADAPALVRRVRRVVTLDAVRTPNGSWESSPPNRTVALPSLPGELDLMAMTATERGPVALMRAADAQVSAAPWRLLWLEGSQWRDWPLPDEPRLARSSTCAARLITKPATALGGDEQIELWLAWPGEPASRWSARVEPATAKPEPITSEPPAGLPVRAGLVWKRDDRAGERPGNLPSGFTLADLGLAWVDGRLIAWNLVAAALAAPAAPAVSPAATPSTDPIAARFFAQLSSGTGWIELAATSAGDEYVAVVPVPGLSRVAMVWSSPPVATTRGNPQDNPQGTAPPGNEMLAITAESGRGYSVREVSTVDGAVVNNHQSQKRSPIGPDQFYLLAAAFGALLAAVVVFVMRSERPTNLPLPAGASLCGPTRRLGAALIDLMPAVLVSAGIVGVPISELLGSRAIEEPGQTLWVLAVALGVAGVYTSLAEMVWGRSVGKIALGMYVVGYRQLRPDGPIKPPSDLATEDSAGQAADQPAGQTERSSGEESPLVRIGSWELAAPTPIQAVIRNIVRWWMLPLTLTVLFNDHTRHPGDLLAKTMVVVRDPPSEEEESDE